MFNCAELLIARCGLTRLQFDCIKELIDSTSGFDVFNYIHGLLVAKMYLPNNQRFAEQDLAACEADAGAWLKAHRGYKRAPKAAKAAELSKLRRRSVQYMC